MPPNGVRYPLVGGMRQRYFSGNNLKPRKLLENAQTPTSRVHAVLGGVVPYLYFGIAGASPVSPQSQQCTSVGEA
jgi:hypothetical protein